MARRGTRDVDEKEHHQELDGDQSEAGLQEQAQQNERGRQGVVDPRRVGARVRAVTWV